jgi:hypothetical protein
MCEFKVSKSMSKDIIVIVKDKLMSVDTVIPILIELKENYGISSTVMVDGELAHRGINENIVLRDAIDYVGLELFFGSSSPYRFLRKLNKIKWLIFITWKLIIGTKILHFGIFTVFPFSFIGKFFLKNLYFLQSDSFKHSYSKFDEVVNKNPCTISPIGNNIVAFNNGMRHLKILNDSQKVFMFGATRVRKSWINYIGKRSEYYVQKYHNNVDFSKGCIILILSYFGRMPAQRIPNDSISIVFKKTIEVLNKEKGDLPVLLKPHVFTDLDIVNKEIYDKDDFHITYLHPTVLASKAKVFICNTYSTTMADAYSLGVRTVEYSDYSSDVLQISGGKSLGYEYIDKFINNDKNKFKKNIKSILSTKSFGINSRIIKDVNTDAEKLLTNLSK